MSYSIVPTALSCPIANDPFEQTDLADKLPDEVAKLKKQYEAWFDDVTRKGFDPPRIVVGSDRENPVRLSRQDWRGPKAGWAADSEGHWEVRVARAGMYRITLRSDAKFTESGLSTDGEGYNYKSTAPTDHVRKTVTLKEGDNRFRAWVESDGNRRGVNYLEVEYVE